MATVISCLRPQKINTTKLMLRYIKDFYESFTMWGWIVVMGIISVALLFWSMLFSRLKKQNKNEAYWHNKLMEEEDAEVLALDDEIDHKKEYESKSIF